MTSVDCGGLGATLSGAPEASGASSSRTPAGELAGYTDSHWAGCRKIARSTSGGAVLRRRHTLETWSATGGDGEDEL